MSESPSGDSGSSAPDLYGQAYYASSCGPVAYDRSEPHWSAFFGKIADDLVRTFRPQRVFDAGCALGFLVEALWDRGVVTYGRDISDYAISQTRADIQPFCSVGSLTDPIEGQFDLVVCIEVLEHMTEADGMRAIANMTAAADRVVFSSSPDDLTETTHINVKPAIYWMKAFGEHNFAPVIETTLFSITSYALVFERKETKPSEAFLSACAEIVRGRMKSAAHALKVHELSLALSEKDRAIAAIRAEHDQLAVEHDQLAAVHDQLRAETDRWHSQHDQVFAEKEQTRAELAALGLAQAQLARERDRLVADRDRLLDERDRLLSDHERAEADRTALIVAQAEFTALRDRSEKERLESIRVSLDDIIEMNAHLQVLNDQMSRSRLWRLGRKLRRVANRGRSTLLRRPPDHVAGPARNAQTTASIGVKLGLDPAFYVDHYPDLAQAGVDPLEHYVLFGQHEGRAPSLYALEKSARIKSAEALEQIERAQPPQADRAAPELWRLRDLCDPEWDEAGPRAFDEAFRISVLTPVYNIEPRYVRELYQTLRNQRYANWEWVVVDDGSTDARTIAALRLLADGDARINLTLSLKNLGISGASNIALANVSGTYTALVDHDDLVPRDAFLALYEAWKEAPDTQLFFTDECKLLPNGELGQFWPKPDWSPVYLENTMCLGHLSVYETSFLRSLGGFRLAFDGTQDFDLALRASLAGPRVKHLPVFAYIWRIIPGSAAADLYEKPYAIERQGRAVLDYARQKDDRATVLPGFGGGYWRIIYPLPTPTPLLSYIIPTAGGSRMIGGKTVDLVLNCIRSFEAKSFYARCEYIVMHSGDPTEEQVRALEAIPGVRLIRHRASAFNFSETVNLGAAAATGDYICLLNDDVEAITEHGGDDLVGYLAANPSVGAIGPMCLYEDGTIQQNGVLLSALGPAHAGDRQPPSFGGHQELLRCRRECFCIGAAVMVVRKQVFSELGGFDEMFPLNYNDVDFGVRVRESGLSCVVDPYIHVYHYEGATKIGTSMVEQERFFLKHPGVADPYFSRWFDQSSATYRMELGHKPTDRRFAGWLDRHIAQRAAVLVPEHEPKLSVCVAVYNQPKRVLEEMYNSVRMQTYAEKELVILDNGSTSPETLAWLDRVRAQGQAVVARLDVSDGVGGTTRRLLDLMTGAFFVSMDADDFLSVDALQVMAHAIGRHPGRRVFYSDEYRADANSSRILPFYKPDFDPVLLTNFFYAAHLMAMDAVFLRELVARAEPPIAWLHDHDRLTLALAAGEEPVHVREPIYASRIDADATVPETIDVQRLALERLLEARGQADSLSVEPNTLDPAGGMWRLRAREPVPGIRRFEASEVWGEGGIGVAGLLAAAAEAPWIAILPEGDADSALLDLSAPAWVDARVVAVGGVFVEASGVVKWSGGLFLPHGSVFDPYAGRLFAEGGYHGQLWCQRCVDIVAPVQVLLRSKAVLQAAARVGTADADGLMAMLGLNAHEAGDLIAVTPHLRREPPPMTLGWLPFDRAGQLRQHASLVEGSRWYNGRLRTDPPYCMPGQV